MKLNKNLIAAAAVAGLFAGTSLHAASVAGQAADGSTITLQDKAPPAGGEKPAEGDKKPAEGEKAKCSGKDGCSGKKDGEKAKCSGKDGCEGKKDGDKKKAE